MDMFCINLKDIFDRGIVLAATFWRFLKNE
jgi:hypothetical protein